MGAVLLVKFIWSILTQNCKRIKRCLVKDPYYTMLATGSIISREDYEALTIGRVSRGKCDIITFQDPKMERYSAESDRILTAAKKNLCEANTKRKEKAESILKRKDEKNWN